MFWCLLPAGAFISQDNYVKLFFTTFHRHVILQVLLFSIPMNETLLIWTVIYPLAKYVKAAPVTIVMFNQVQLIVITSAKISLLRL